MRKDPLALLGRALRRAGNEILARTGLRGTWIDVGAYHGDLTIWHAQRNPGLTIYAFEPNLRAASTILGRFSNYIVIPMAVAEKDGIAEFHLNAFEMSSSLLPMDEQAVKSWIGGEALKLASIQNVPTIRLDSFMELVGIDKVDFLKIDAQGTDLSVVRSAGSRLRDISNILMEVSIAPIPVYIGEPSKEEVVEFMSRAGFRLQEAQQQTYGQEENLLFTRRASGEAFLTESERHP